jgi:type I restriction enzyme S subunit
LTDKFLDSMSRLQTGASYPAVNDTQVRQQEVTYPPLPEQQRIVAILDEAFAGLATATAYAEKNFNQARQLFESHLNSVLEQKGEGWVDKTLGEICTFENGDRGKNYPSRSVRSSKGVPFINAGHLTDDGIDLENVDFIPRELFSLLSNGKIRPQDILFCLRGSLGKYASVGTLKEGAIASSLVIVRPTNGVTQEFLLLYLGSRLCSDMIARFGNGAAQPNLSARSLGEFEIPVPPALEQSQIVEKCKKLQEHTRNLSANYRAKCRNIAMLKQSILQKAFSGELSSLPSQAIKEAAE